MEQSGHLIYLFNIKYVSYKLKTSYLWTFIIDNPVQ